MSCLKTYAQDIPSTGEINESDTVCVSIPIKYIRLANEKMIERNYLIEANRYKDSLIVDYRNWIIEYDSYITKYQKEVNTYNMINKDLYRSLEKANKRNKFFATIAGTSIVSLILVCLIN